MNRPLLGRIVPFLFAFYAVAFLAFFAYALFTFSVSLYLPALRWEYALKRGFILFMDYLIPVHAAAIAVAASLAGSTQSPRAPGGPAQPFNRVISSTVAMFLVLAAGYTVLYEGAYPGVRQRLTDMRYLSSLAREFRSEADAAVKKGDYRAGVDALDRYLAIDTQNKAAAELRLGWKGMADRQSPTPPPPVVAGQPSESMDAQALVEKARYYLDREDWFSAHYYAQRAATLDPRRRDALELAAQAREKLNRSSAAETDAQKAELFQRKKAAYALLVGGDALSAYYRFAALKSEYPKDQDILKYFTEASSKVAETTFFLDGAQRVQALPGVQKILFLNRREADATEAVYIGKMVVLPAEGAYFYDIEAIRYTSSGAVAWHFKAPYGRREGSSILMHCIEKDNAQVQFLPIYYEGTRPPADRAVLALGPSVEELRVLSLSRDTTADTGLADLWRMRGALGSFGMSRQTLNVELVMRVLMPFAFLILSLFAVAMGWAFRLRTLGRLPLLPGLLTPLVPLVFALLSLLYVHAQRVILGFAVLAFGLSAALIVLAVLQAVLLAVSLVMLAGQSAQ